MTSPPTAPSDAQSNLVARFPWRWRALARLAWVVTTVFDIGTFLSAIPLRYSELVTLSAPRVVSAAGQMVNAPVLRSNLAQLGWTTAFYATFSVLLDILLVLGFVGVAIIIFARKSDDGMALLVSLALVTMGASFPNTTFALIARDGFGELAEHLLGSLTFALIVLTFYLFPDGHFVPAWSKWLALLWLVFAFVLPWLPGSQVEAGTVQYDAAITLTLGILITIVGFQIYRYSRVSTPKQRLQTKWVVFGVAAGLTGYFVLILPLAMNPSFYAPGSPTELVVSVALTVFALLIPSSIGIAILRGRLYDIDLLINRTLVYVPLTAILAGIFAACTSLIQKIFIAVTGQSSDAVTVLTTLVVVAAFTPIKDSLQILVDKRFKEPADPSKKLEAFAAQLRERMWAVDTRHMSRRLLEEVVSAFEAQSGAVYLSHDESAEPFYTLGNWKGKAELGASLETNGHKIGRISLGVRRHAREYAKQDRAALEQIAQLASQAIEEDQEA